MIETDTKERAFIGSVLLDGSILDRTPDLDEKHFSDPVNRKVYAILKRMRETGEPIDKILLREAAKSDGIKPIDIARLIDGEVTPAHAGFYLDGMQESSRLRELDAGVRSAVEAIKHPSASSEAIRANLEALLEATIPDRKGGPVQIGKAARELIDTLNSDRKRPMCWSGMSGLDTNIGGFAPGELIVVAARPGHGKTSLAMQIAMHNGLAARPVLFFSLEMTRLELVARVLCGMTATDSRDIRAGRVHREQMEQLDTACRELDEYTIRIVDRSRLTLAKIRADSRAMKISDGLSLVIVDYLSLVKPRDIRAPREEQVAEISHGLKDLAKELEIPVLALQQLNREAEKGEPKLSHLRESGAVEQDADVVVFPYPDGDKFTDQYQLLVAKNRHGSTGKVPCTFDRANTKFVEQSNHFAEFDK